MTVDATLIHEFVGLGLLVTLLLAFTLGGIYVVSYFSWR